MTSTAAAVSRWTNSLPALLGCDDKALAYAPDESTGGKGSLGLECRTERGGYRFWITITGYLGREAGLAQLIVGQYK
jgi:hypothetical protein